MESSDGAKNVVTASAIAERQPTSMAAIRITLIFIAALLVACTAPNTDPKATPVSQDIGRTPLFLVASPDMPDPLFQQTVILMLPTSDLPIVAGLVINKPTKMTLGQLFSHSPAIANQADPVYFGGPVELTTPVVLMRASRTPDATTHLFENIYMSIDAAPVREFLKRPGSEKDFRLFLGRAQWTPDQLHSEILRGAWVVTPASPELVFSPDPASIWQTLVQRAKLRQIEWRSRVISGASRTALFQPLREQSLSAHGAPPDPNSFSIHRAGPAIIASYTNGGPLSHVQHW
jgi:putative transcriptional regulator